MVRVFIADTDRSSSVAGGSVAIEEALTSQPDTCRFQMEDYQPTAGQEVMLWDTTFLTAAVVAGSSVAISVDNVFSDDAKFNVGDTVVLGIGTANEEQVVLSAIGASSLTAATVTHSHVAGEYIGIKIFGGVILSVTSVEVEKNTSYVLWNVDCGDYASVMDRKIINNVWESQTPHQILYDIINTINYTSLLDGLEYSSNVAIQAVWSKGLDAALATTSSSAPKIGSYNGVFSWTYSGGTAVWSGALTSKDVSGIVGVSSGTPTQGLLTFWIKCTDPSKISGCVLQLGSDSSHYRQYTVPVASITTDWTRIEIDLTNYGSALGSPVWTACDYLAFTITETGSAVVSLDDIRISGDASYTFDNVSTSGTALDQFTSSFQSAREAINQLAKQAGEWDWYVDYERDVHFYPPSTEAPPAPFEITESSVNHEGFSAQPDLSQVRNRIYIRGGSEESATQTEEQYGDGVKTVFFTAESPRSTGPYLYDLLLYVDTGGGYVAKTYGIANHDAPGTYEFLVNPEEKYIANDTHAVLSDTDTIKAVYTYAKPILIRQDDTASQAALKALQPGTDGIYEHVIVDKGIESTLVARAYAQAQLEQYSNALITVTFNTNMDGLHAGQAITITKPSHGVGGDYLIQRVSRSQLGLEHWQYAVTCASTIFGMTELLIHLLKEDLNENGSQTVDLLDTASETITIADSVVTDLTSTKYRWKVATPAGEGTVWNRFSWA